MSDSNNDTFVDPNTDDLNAFEDLLHGRAKELTDTDEQASESKVETDDEDDAPTENEAVTTDTEEVDTLEDEEETEDEDTGDEEDEPAPKPKPKNRLQERIDELTRDKYEAQRRADALEERLRKLETPTTDTPSPTKAPEATPGPQPSDTNEDGSEKYPLGEFDPNYIRDLTRHVMAEERAAAEAEAKQRAEQTAKQSEQAKLESEWADKLTKAQADKYPDFLEKNMALESTLGDLDEGYGQYLANTIMGMEYGTDVLYHLASNPTEAKAIASMGPQRATVALGRLEALYANKAEAERKAPQPLKVSSAKEPPKVNKGTSVSQTVPDDTDDLDAFERKMFDKRRR